MGRRTVLEVGVALLVGAVVGTVAHVSLGPRSAASAPAAQVAGVAVERTGDVPPEVTAAATSSVVQVHAAGCGTERQASATYVRDDAGRELVLTNVHVVRGASSVSAVLPGGGTVELAVLARLVGKDAALLDPAPLRAAGVRAASQGPAIGVGDPVVVAGYPAGTFRLDGAAVDDVQRRAGYGSASDVLVVGAPARGGHSGGALLGPTGQVVGLVAARDPGTGRVVAYSIAELTGADQGALPGC